MSNEPKPDDIVEVHVHWTETVEYAKTIRITRAKFDEYDKLLNKRLREKELVDVLHKLNCTGNGDWQDSTPKSIDTFEIAKPEDADVG